MSIRNVFKHLLIATCLLASATAFAQSKQLLDNAKALMAAGDAQGAYELLIPLQGEFAGNPEYDLLLGVAAIDSGHEGEAVFALERVVAVQPDNTLARAELGRAFLRLSELDSARREFERVSQADDIPAPARETIVSYLDLFAAREQAARTDWRGYLGTELGYDSNVNAGVDSRCVIVPAVVGVTAATAVCPAGRVDVGEDGAEVSSAFARVLAGVSVVHKFSPQWAATVRFDSSHRIHKSGSNFESGDVMAQIGGIYSDGPNQFMLAYQGDRFSSDPTPNLGAGELPGGNRNANGFMAQWRGVIDDLSQVRVYGQFQRLTYRNQQARNANRWTGGISYSRAFPDVALEPVGFVSFRGGDEQNYADAAPHVGHQFYSVSVGGQAKVTPDTTMFGSLYYGVRNYDAPVPGFFSDRDDKRYEVQLGAHWTGIKDWTVSPRIQLTHNDSNTSISDFERSVASVIIRRDFD